MLFLKQTIDFRILSPLRWKVITICSRLICKLYLTSPCIRIYIVELTIKVNIVGSRFSFHPYNRVRCLPLVKWVPNMCLLARYFHLTFKKKAYSWIGPPISSWAQPGWNKLPRLTHSQVPPIFPLKCLSPFSSWVFSLEDAQYTIKRKLVEPRICTLVRFQINYSEFLKPFVSEYCTSTRFQIFTYFLFSKYVSYFSLKVLFYVKIHPSFMAIMSFIRYTVTESHTIWYHDYRNIDSDVVTCRGVHKKLKPKTKYRKVG